MRKLVSIIVPVHNEQENIGLLYDQLKKVVADTEFDYELIFVNDGSADESSTQIERLCSQDAAVRHLEFSRNFGKEFAITAGLNFCEGEAAIILDADLQHPVALLPEFLDRWRRGAEVVVGVRRRNKSAGILKRLGSYWFYKLMNAISDHKLVPQSTDFRLLDRAVIDEFNRLSERSRITRGLIDWLGFKREYIYFEANERASGRPVYSLSKLAKLALVSFMSMSLAPLRLAAYLGVCIVLASGALGIVMLLDRYFVRWHLNFSGPAMLATLILFLVGIILVCIGILAFYVGNIYHEVQNRPMYVVRKGRQRPK